MSTRPHLHTRPKLVFVMGCALCGCSLTPGGPEYTELGLRVEDGSNVVLEGTCTPLPVLPGGTVVRDATLASELSAHLFAVRDSIEVTLHGVEDEAASRRVFTQEKLYAGFSEIEPVTTVTGVNYTVVFDSPCMDTDSPAGK
jgi:hypothetical protein